MLNPAPPLSFVLPPDREAKEPPEARGLPRDGVRMLVSRRGGCGLAHARFLDLPGFLEPGDLLVVNDSATLPARLTARRPGEDAAVAVHLSTRLPGGLWVVEPRDTAPAAGETWTLPEGARLLLLAPYGDSRRLWLARLELPGEPLTYLHRHGEPIRYRYVDRAWPLAAYQTVFAREPGSAEMPSAGRPFSRRVLDALASRGVGVAAITLHTGVASLELDEPPYEEWYQVPARTAELVNRARAAGRRVVAVGTTVVRALESAAEADGTVIASRGWTDLVITPGRGLRAVDALLTGFHEPRSTHLAMLGALLDAADLERAYRAALDGGYLWHEFGDVHLIL